MQGTLTEVLTKFLQDVDDMLPARVVSFDRAKNTATVVPLIMVLKTDGSTQQRAEIAGIPVFQYSGGGFVINFPLKAGDLGWIKATDRDIALFKQSYDFSPPNTLRKHKFSDAIFYPDVMRGWTINEDGLVIQTLSGNQCIAILDDQIKILSDNLITIKSDADIVVEAGGDVTVTAAGSVTIDAPDTTITGTLSVDGAATFGSTIDASGQITTGGIGLSTHKHTGVEPGIGTSGGPVA